MPDYARPGALRLGQLRLPLIRTAPKAARDLVAGIGRMWNLSDETVHSAELAVSELVTNSLLHAMGVPGSMVTVTVSRVRDAFAVEVHDTSRLEPYLRMPGDDSESGRGLMLVCAATDDFGHGPAPLGKVVWFTIKCDWPLDSAISP